MNKVKQESKYLTAEEVAAILEVSPATAYRRIRQLNQELKAKGYVIVTGKIPRRFFEERMYV